MFLESIEKTRQRVSLLADPELIAVTERVFRHHGYLLGPKNKPIRQVWATEVLRSYAKGYTSLRIYQAYTAGNLPPVAAIRTQLTELEALPMQDILQSAHFVLGAINQEQYEALKQAYRTELQWLRIWLANCEDLKANQQQQDLFANKLSA
jgi:hypothetical protein